MRETPGGSDGESYAPAAAEDFAPTAQQAEPDGESPTVRRPISTQEREEVEQDPAVREVMALFEGKLVDIQREQPATLFPAETGEADNPPVEEVLDDDLDDDDQ
jgi:hypothetical protein